eukprot:gnl/MRDRNA2_/MRDRNA2_60739_c0_seq2.p1 gnl/MRDRNA2_/MRDRNA2_60739_c0~~gnl/MRDRNA2_/MRDRNA2_60739_c0_seq2.p1  ORF type:complete len:117 (+),score=12.23 gnl/MRDRNA2_/MRDRNA2_60739_c0_seq2:119-469(+)
MCVPKRSGMMLRSLHGLYKQGFAKRSMTTRDKALGVNNFGTGEFMGVCHVQTNDNVRWLTAVDVAARCQPISSRFPVGYVGWQAFHGILIYSDGIGSFQGNFASLGVDFHVKDVLV